MPQGPEALKLSYELKEEPLAKDNWLRPILPVAIRHEKIAKDLQEK